jgi:phage shock protein C
MKFLSGEKNMSRDKWNLDKGSLRGIYRDRENGWIFGVCAGIADFANFRVGTVRLIAVISLIVFFWLTVLVYIAATMLLREKPLIYSGRRAENAFWSRRSYDRRWTRS